MGQRSSWRRFTLTKPKSLVMYPHVTDKPMGERVTSQDLQPCLGAMLRSGRPRDGTCRRWCWARGPGSDLRGRVGPGRRALRKLLSADNPPRAP